MGFASPRLGVHALGHGQNITGGCFHHNDRSHGISLVADKLGEVSLQFRIDGRISRRSIFCCDAKHALQRLILQHCLRQFGFFRWIFRKLVGVATGKPTDHESRSRSAQKKGT